MLVWLLGLFSRYHWRLPLPFTHVASSLRPSPKLQRSSTSCKGDSFCWELYFGILRCSFTDTVSGGQRRLQRAQVCQLLPPCLLMRSPCHRRLPGGVSRHSEPMKHTLMTLHRLSCIRSCEHAQSRRQATKLKIIQWERVSGSPANWNAWEGSFLSWLKQEAHLALR